MTAIPCKNIIGIHNKSIEIKIPYCRVLVIVVTLEKCIVKVVKEYYPDPTDKTGKFVVVDIAAKKNFINPVSLAQIKLNKNLHHLALIKQSRLSVMPVDKASWNLIKKISLRSK